MRGTKSKLRAFPEVKVVHKTVPGRVRLKVDRLYRNPRLALHLESELLQISSITKISLNPLTGHLLIIFRPKQISLQTLMRLIRKTIRNKPKSRSRAVHPSCTQQWQKLDLKTLEKQLGTSLESGLNSQQVSKQIEKYGSNYIAKIHRRSELSIFLHQFQNLPTSLLILSSGLSVLSGGVFDAAVILGVVLINSYIGYIMESSAEKTISSIVKERKKLIPVIRGGDQLEVKSREIVVGDLISLSPGMIIPADARLIRANNLSIDESILTGESLPVDKSIEQSNLVFKGCSVTSGSGLGLVVSVGRSTEVGKIQILMTESTQPQTPLQQQLTQLGNHSVAFSGISAGAVFVLGLLKGHSMINTFKTSIALAVAAIPESLPTVATMTLARGISSLKKHQIHIRHIDSVETLASTDVICLDKTGTLTLNQMEIARVSTPFESYRYTPGKLVRNHQKVDLEPSSPVYQLVSIATLCNEARYRKNKEFLSPKNSPTELALLRMGYELGIKPDHLRKEFPLVSIQRRSENQQYMITQHSHLSSQETLLAVKGSPLQVLSLCRYFEKQGQTIPLDEFTLRRIRKQNDQMAQEGLRVLGLAHGREKEGLIWSGLVGMADPIRSGMKELVNQLREAGIKTYMITGDQEMTAHTIGRSVGVDHVFARVSPSQKLRIIQRLQRQGKIVTMIGDGINDGPALKAADIGIAMASRGTEIASQAADIIPTDDNIKGMIHAIREGRTVHSNIKKAIDYIISQNLSEILFTFLSVLFGQRQPFSPLQFLWINLVTDIFPELALAQEPAELDILKQKPFRIAEQFFSKQDLQRISYEAFILALTPLITYFYSLKYTRCETRSRSLAFLTLTASSLFYTLSARSPRVSIFEYDKLNKNKYIPLAIETGFLAELSAVFIPALSKIMGLERVKGADLLVSTMNSILSLGVIETSKMLRKEPAA